MAKASERAKALAIDSSDKFVKACQLAILAGLLVPGAVIGLALVIGHSMAPVTPSPAVYDLVQYHGPESDIIDYDLSASDCRSMAIQHARHGRVVACEPAAR